MKFLDENFDNKNRAELNKDAEKVDAQMKAIMNGKFRTTERLNREITAVYFANKLLLTKTQN
jgi:hypothetical protein